MNPEQENPNQGTVANSGVDNPTSPASAQMGATGPAVVGGQPVQPGAPQPADGNPKSKKALIITLVTLLVLALGVATYYMLNKDDEPGNTEETSETIEQDPATDKDTSEEGADPGAVQDAQTDLSQKTQASKLLASINVYAANNNGAVPMLSQLDNEFVKSYLDGSFEDPVTGEQYAFVSEAPKAGEVQYAPGTSCGEDNETVAASSRSASVRVLLSDDSFYCVNN